jgi:hypothetical protein
MMIARKIRPMTIATTAILSLKPLLKEPLKVDFDDIKSPVASLS